MLSEVAPFSNEMPQSGSTMFQESELTCIEPPKPPKPKPHKTSAGSGIGLMIVFVIVYAIFRCGRIIVKAEKQNTRTKDQYD